MGIFNFLKKKEEPEEQIISQTQEQDQETQPQQQAEVKTKNCIADFFNFDICHISPDDFPERVVLKKLELGMFPYVEVYSKEGKVNSVEFISHSKKFSPELTEFINRCAKTFGPTKGGESMLTQQDEFFLVRGIFSRLWHPIWLECGPDDENGGITSLRVTIFNPSKNGELII